MPAAKTIEQLTAKYARFRAIDGIQCWAAYRECSDMLRRLEQEIAQQRDATKKEGLLLVKQELQASRDDAKARLPPQTKFQRVLERTAAGAILAADAHKQAVRRVKNDMMIITASMKVQTGHVADAGEVVRDLLNGKEDEALPMEETDTEAAPGVAALEAALAADERTDADGMPLAAPPPAAKARGKAKARATPSPAVSSLALTDEFFESEGVNFTPWSDADAAVRRRQLCEAYDVPQLVVAIKRHQPSFVNNRQKRESLARKLITLSARDADSMWRRRNTSSGPPAPGIHHQRVVDCRECGGVFHGARGLGLHKCTMSAYASSAPAASSGDGAPHAPDPLGDAVLVTPPLVAATLATSPVAESAAGASHAMDAAAGAMDVAAGAPIAGGATAATAAVEGSAAPRVVGDTVTTMGRLVDVVDDSGDEGAGMP